MSDIRSTLFNATKNVTKSSGALFQTAKLSVKLANEQEQLKNLYIDVGKKVHEIYLYGGTLGKFFDEKYRELEACERKINDLKEQIGQIKGTRECAKCGKTVERTADFCPKCGARQDTAESRGAMQENGRNMRAEAASEAPVSADMPSLSGMADADSAYAASILPSPLPDIPPIPEAPPPGPPEPAPAIRKTRKCNACGAENGFDTKFCLTCGRLL